MSAPNSRSQVSRREVPAFASSEGIGNGIMNRAPAPKPPQGMIPQMLSPFIPGAAGAQVVPGVATVGGGEVGAGAAMSWARAVGARIMNSAPAASTNLVRIPNVPSAVFMISPVASPLNLTSTETKAKQLEHRKLTFVHPRNPSESREKLGD